MEWRPAPGFPGYEISADGQIRRSAPAKGGVVGKVLRPYIKNGGYRDIVLRRDGKFVHARLARLVCEAWRGPPPTPEHECCHNDGNPANDHYTNLRWGTSSENKIDKLRHGTHARGENCVNARLTWEKVDAIRVRYAAGGITMRELAEEYDIFETAIWKIIHYKRWVRPPE